MSKERDDGANAPTEDWVHDTVRPRGTATPRPELPVVNLEARYGQLTPLAEGGMGEIWIGRDRHLAREIAIKTIRPAHLKSDNTEARFLREALVQGQLEHPGVAPVHDLGMDHEGRLFFTMKRIRGITLAEVLFGHSKGDRAITERFGLARLLSAFHSVCLTIELAHSRGILHRDLKPANIMLGDYGEVYVLDWGIAHLLAESPSGWAWEVMSLIGSVTGTPGYMSPEQLTAEHGPLSPRSDIYGLGAILFEILTRTPLHPGSDIKDRIRSTIAGVDPRPASRAPSRGIPPELDAICAKACAALPKDRQTSAAELASAIERYLEGDRDAALRKRAAAEHLRHARELLTSRSDESRAEVMRLIVRAVALDPDSTDATRDLTRLLLEVPETLPPAAEQRFVQVSLQARRTLASVIAGGSVLVLLMLAPLLWMGVKSTPLFAGYVGVTVGLLLLSLHLMRSPAMNRPRQFAFMLLGAAMLGLASRQVGPLMLVPGSAGILAIGFGVTVERRYEPWMIASGVGIIGVLVLLEVIGVLPRSYLFANGTLIIQPQMVELPEVPTMVFLSLAALMHVAVLALIATRYHRRYRDAAARLQLHAWYLETMLGEVRR